MLFLVYLYDKYFFIPVTKIKEACSDRLNTVV